MSAALKPKWVGFEEHFLRTGKRRGESSGDEDLGQHIALKEILDALKWGLWIARTTSPESFALTHGEHSHPLEEGGELPPVFWMYVEDALQSPIRVEALARGGPWGDWGYNSFEFGLPGDHIGPIAGQVEGVEIWVRTGEFAKPKRGERGPGRTDAYGYAGAAARIKANVDATEGEVAKRRVRREGIARELANGVGEGHPENRKRHLERRLIKIGCRANAPRKKHQKIA